MKVNGEKIELAPLFLNDEERANIQDAFKIKHRGSWRVGLSLLITGAGLAAAGFAIAPNVPTSDNIDNVNAESTITNVPLDLAIAGISLIAAGGITLVVRDEKRLKLEEKIAESRLPGHTPVDISLPPEVLSRFI